MNKSTYSKLFDKANNYYVKHQGTVTQKSENYKQFKAACDQLIASDHNSITSDDSYAYKKLNALFDQPSAEDLLNDDW